MQSEPTINHLAAKAEEIKNVQIPKGDFDGVPLNHIPGLSQQDQELVDNLTEQLRNYTRKDYLTPNNAAITRLNKRGFITSLSTRQDNPMSLAGRVQIGEHTLDIGDPLDETDE